MVRHGNSWPERACASSLLAKGVLERRPGGVLCAVLLSARVGGGPTMNVVVLGSDGYTGWPLVARLLDHGHRVHGIDHCGAREYRGRSVTPIDEHATRAAIANETLDGTYSYDTGLDVTRYRGLRAALSKHDPDAIVNLAQIPSAPYSMRGPADAWDTHRNNVQGSLNLLWALKELDRTDTHVVQLATMGEYGTPEAGIPEGFLPDGRPAPKEPGSFYHASKVATTVNTIFAARAWGLPVTECYQGIVYGVHTDATDRDPALRTRFDADATWGTVLNRFTAQAAVGHPLTVYGEGGQCRAMLSLQDCVRCIHLLLENPPEGYRAVNQFDGAYRVREVADMVADETGADVTTVENPRVEDDSAHAFDPERGVLDELGYAPERSIREELRRTYATVCEHRERIDTDSLSPRTVWADA